MKYDVYIRTACSVYDVEAKTEKSAKIKALELMLKELKKDNATDGQVQNLEVTYVLDSDEWYEPDKSEIKSLNFPEGCEIESEPEINGVKSLNYKSGIIK